MTRTGAGWSRPARLNKNDRETSRHPTDQVVIFSVLQKTIAPVGGKICASGRSPVREAGADLVLNVRELLSVRWGLCGGLILAGVLSLAFPGLLVVRAVLLEENPETNLFLIRALGFALIGTGLAVAVEPRDGTGGAFARFWAPLLLLPLLVLYLVMLGLHLRDWWIDDAGITFAYSRSLAEGLGLVAQPWLPPEEGYSSSAWMLLLALSARLGADIPMTAKVLGIGFSALSIVICALILLRETRSPLAILICGIGIACGPTVTWAASGQEHALQGLLLLAVVLCAYLFENWRWPAAVILSILVLTRPEAPIIVIGVFIAAVFLTWRRRGPLVNAADLALALIPFLTFLTLMAFRLLYFGDPLPNPFYAKSSSAGFAGLLNPLGGGWAYILSGLRDTALLFVLALAFALRPRRFAPWVIVAMAILISHTVFVVWAKGDWMGQYRFLMPVLPIALLIASSGLRDLPSFGLRMGFGVAAVLIVTHTTILQLAAYKASPTTPMAAVTDVGNRFRALADRLEIETPMLAHHDAGGIAYHRMVRLVDLGGLINRSHRQEYGRQGFPDLPTF